MNFISTRSKCWAGWESLNFQGPAAESQRDNSDHPRLQITPPPSPRPAVLLILRPSLGLGAVIAAEVLCFLFLFSEGGCKQIAQKYADRQPGRFLFCCFTAVQGVQRCPKMSAQHFSILAPLVAPARAHTRVANSYSEKWRRPPAVLGAMTFTGQ